MSLLATLKLAVLLALLGSGLRRRVLSRCLLVLQRLLSVRRLAILFPLLTTSLVLLVTPLLIASLRFSLALLCLLSVAASLTVLGLAVLGLAVLGLVSVAVVLLGLVMLPAALLAASLSSLSLLGLTTAARAAVAAGVGLQLLAVLVRRSIPDVSLAEFSRHVRIEVLGDRPLSAASLIDVSIPLVLIVWNPAHEKSRAERPVTLATTPPRIKAGPVQIGREERSLEDRDGSVGRGRSRATDRRPRLAESTAGVRGGSSSPISSSPRRP